MADRDKDGGQSGLEGKSDGVSQPGFAGGYGRDFGGGRNQGFDGSHGEGYGGSLDATDYREGFRQTERSYFDARGDEASGPHRGRGPRGWSPSDDRIREEVSDALMEDRLLDARGIEVEVADGAVTLRGEVGGHSDPQLAERIARGVAGVKDVTTELSVSDRANPKLEDPNRRDREDRSPLGYPILPT